MCLVDPSSGRLTLVETDFSLPGLIPLRLERSYRSSNIWEGDLGFGWGHAWGVRLWAEDRGRTLVYRDPDGRRIPVPTPGDEPTRNDGEGVSIRIAPPADLAGWERLADLTEGAWAVDVRGMPTMLFGRSEVQKVFPFRAWADRFSNVVAIRPGRDGLPARAHDSHGRTVHFERDSHGRLTRVAFDSPIAGPPAIVLVRYEYDDRGDLVGVSDAAGTRRYTYNREHRLLSHADRLGAHCISVYDDQGRCVQTGALGEVKTRRFRYVADAHRTVITDSLGAEDVVEFNDGEQVVAVTAADGGVSRYDYDGEGRLVRTTDPLGGETSVLFDDHGGSAGIARPDGSVEATKSDDTGALALWLSAAGAVATFERDPLGRVVAMKRPGRGTVALEWNERGEMTAVTVPHGRKLTIERSPDRRTLVERDDDGVVTSQELDAFGRVVSLRDALGAETQFQYDGRGFLTEKTFADGARRQFEWDAEGRMIAYTDETGGTTRFEVDEAGREVTVRRPDGRVLRKTYDAESRLLEVESPDGSRHTWKYNARGHVTATGFPDGRTVHFELDLLGRIVGRSDGVITTSATRDPVGRLSQVRYSDGGSKSAEHDPDGHWIRVAEGERILEREVTPDGFAIRETQDDFWVLREFAETGSLLCVTDSVGQRVTYAYDDLGRVVAMTTCAGRWEDGKWMPAAPPRAHRFEYDRAGRRIAWDMPGGRRESRRYDVRGRLVEQVVVRGDETLLRRRYGYAPGGRVTRIEDSLRGERRFEHDALGRLVAVHENGGTRTFEYDLSDDRVTGLAYEAPHRVKSAAGRTYLYDARGHVVERLTPRGSEAYRWTARGLLESVTHADGRITRYEYDPHDRLLARHDGDRTRTFHWNDERLWAIAERETRVVFAGLPDEWSPLEQASAAGALTAHTDALGTIMELMDDEGRIVWRRDAGPWGEGFRGPTEATLPRSSAFGLIGQIQDEITGLCYNRYRIYDPDSGHYLTPDPVGVLGGLDPYAYADDPVNLFDPKGLKCRGKTDDPELLRGDGRPPSDICANGFQPSNPNANISAFTHVEGVPATGSNWISTTYDQATAERFARSGAASDKAPPNAQPWVYVIKNPGCGVEVDCLPESIAKYGADAQGEDEIAFDGGLPGGPNGVISGYYHADLGPSSFKPC